MLLACSIFNLFYFFRCSFSGSGEWEAGVVKGRGRGEKWRGGEQKGKCEMSRWGAGRKVCEFR